jgi:hypothetical protein
MTEGSEEEEFETIKSTLMIRICDRKKGNIANLNEIIDSYTGYHKKEVIQEAIERYRKEKAFYDVLKDEIVLTETGIKECQRKIPGQS